jgi:N-acetylmuramoyl-L-alanine amidase
VLAIQSHAASFSTITCKIDGQEVKSYTPVITDGQDIYLPLESLKYFGLSFYLNHRADTVKIILPSHKTAEIALAKPGKDFMAPLHVLANILHATYTFSGDQCDIRYKTAAICDIQSTDSLDSNNASGKAASASQSKINTSGVLQNPTSPDSIGDSAPNKQPDTQAHQAYDNKNPQPPLSISDVKTPAQGSLADVNWVNDDDTHAHILIMFNGAAPSPKMNFSDDNTQIIMVFPNCTSASNTSKWSIDHPFASDITLQNDPQSNGLQLTVNLKQIVITRLTRVSSNSLQVNLTTPANSGKKFSNTRIIVDPGHGGKSTGCHTVVNGKYIYEKELTLSIAKKLYADLQQDNVTAFMTRTDDTFVSLDARPAMENEKNADLFVSIHIDDCPGNNSASGTSVYYHIQDPNSHALARCISAAIAKTSGLPRRGALSDGVLYHSGLAVLRGSVVPAVLVEVGYINNAYDRSKILNDSFQSTVAQAICDGLRTYVEGNLADTQVTQKDNK